MNSKLIGGILLIVGTAIGAGMLALPIAAAQLGFLKSSLLLLISWLIMTSSALLILEVNLWLPPGSNIVSMAKATLGRGGQAVAWIVYVLLFYSLLCAYTAGGGDFLQNLLAKAGIHIPESLASLIFVLCLGYIVYRGIRSVDYVNRGFMFTKLSIFVVLVAIILAFIAPTNLAGGQYKYMTTSFTVMLTSFGFANIIPSLRTYFNDDVKKLRLAVVIGSLIPLVCYLLWDLAIMGVISRDGSQGLLSMMHSGHSASDLANHLGATLNTSTTTILIRVFTSICLATSFLGVSLSLSDFLSDSLKIKKVGKGGIVIAIATFLPPLIIVLVDPSIFISALSHAGIYCLILLVLLPALMAWQGRYRKQLPSRYKVLGGKSLLVALTSVSIAIIVQGVVQSL